MQTVIYRGWLRRLSNGEEDSILCLCPDRGYRSACGDGCEVEPLSWRVRQDVDRHGRYLSVRYYLFDVELSAEEMREAWLRHVMGLSEAEYEMAYSEDTGYLWTTDELAVGGHDLLAELGTYADGGDCFCQLEIDFSQTPAAQ